MRRLLLSHLRSGRRGKVVEITGEDSLKRKLMHMGIYPGREITKVSHLALRGPVTIRAGRTVIALAHSMAHKIRVEAE